MNDEREEYLEERKLLINLQSEATRSFDKFMVTVSAGALGLSITFLHQIAAKPRSETLLYLYVSWISFALALVTILFAFLFSQYAAERQREILDQSYPKNQSGDGQKNLWNLGVTIFNFASTLFFVLGVGTLVWFSIANFPQ